MSIEPYMTHLREVENKFHAYQQDLDHIIGAVSAFVHHTVITKGAIANPTPYYHERMGMKVNGKALPSPVNSDDCMKYHYDRENRLVMIEEYSVFLKQFQITELYLHKEWTERLWLSSGSLARLFVFDHAFSDTGLCLSFSEGNGYAVEEFGYDGGVLREIKISRANAGAALPGEIHRFRYEAQKLIQIERICRNGYQELIYTTKKPDFRRIREEVHHRLKTLITERRGSYVSFGIEGFLDQQQPMFCVCFTQEEQPSDLIADWNTGMQDVWVYDWQFSEAQEKKCVKMIAEIIVELVEEGLLKDKNLYFHQNQVCVAQLYPGAKTVFRKAGISVR